MSIAIKNGGVILKNGKAAESCGCCGGNCSCTAPQQLRLVFSFEDAPGGREVIATQAAYAAFFGSQITNTAQGFFASNSPYPFELYYGVAGYQYDYVMVDPVLGEAPTINDVGVNWCSWAGKGPLRVGARMQIYRRATDQEGGLLFPRDSVCFYVRWFYVEFVVTQPTTGNCPRFYVGAYSESSDYFTLSHFAPVSSSCCIGQQTLYGVSYKANDTYGLQGSASVYVADCA